MKAVKKNLMSSLEGEVEDNLDDIDKADLDEFLMNKEEVEVNKEGKRERENDDTEDKVSRKKRRGQPPTISGVEVKDGVAAEGLDGVADNEDDGEEVEEVLLDQEGEGRRGGEESSDGRQSQPKSFCCEHCGKTFQYSSTLDKHVACHTLPFSCGFCPEAFSRRGYLKIHLSKYHSVKNVDLHRYVSFSHFSFSFSNPVLF